jgi:hypothetical protein
MSLLLKVLKSYTTDLSDVTKLILLDKTTACISSYTGKIIRKVVIDDKIQTIKEIPFMFVILIGLFFFLILPKYNNFPTTFICQLVCIFLHYTQYNVIVISHMDSSCY